MDLFNQAKTVWRLIVFRCDIHTALAVFRTCRENRELSREEPLWRYLCERDYGRVTINSPRTVYRFRYLLGGRVLFAGKAKALSFAPESFRPRYIFDCGDFWWATFDGNDKSIGCNLYPRVSDGNDQSHSVLFDPVLKTAKYPKGICSKPVDMMRLSIWIKRHFDICSVSNLVYFHHCVCFKANMLPGHTSIPVEENIIRYYLFYSGLLNVRDRVVDSLAATLTFEGAKVEIPNFYLA
jgi:hypothetical protein